MNLDVGPAEPASAAAWIQWAEEACERVHPQSDTGVSLPADVVEDLGRYLEQWKPASRTADGTFRWRAEIEPEQLEYLLHSFSNLDLQLSTEAPPSGPAEPPGQGRDFYVVLVHALLHALETESPGRAAFAEQLRSSWPIAGEAI